MKNMLIISYSLLERDPRIQRQISVFNDTFHIETLGRNPANKAIKNFLFKRCTVSDRKYTFQNAIILLKMIFGNYKEYLYHRFLKLPYTYEFTRPDIIIANDWLGLYVACNLKEHFRWNSKTYFDSHEYFPEYSNLLKWKIVTRPMIKYTFKKYRNSFDIMSTVCPSIARMYEKYFDFQPGTVHVVTNAPDYEPGLQPTPVGARIRIIHHGGAIRVRQLEKMIDMMAYLPEDKYELNFMLVLGDKQYYEELQQRAKKYKNIRFLEPVKSGEIASFTNQFDVGLYILDNTIVNNRYALPNKFFEFVQARLAIAIGDSYEMKQYVSKYDLGVAADENTPEALAEKFIKLTKEDIMRYKQNAHKHAMELSAEPNKVELRNIISEINE